ncbi:MAG: aldehyde dehydrogenase family protein [Kordiimonadaceae bacterium]|nr:aldehyde dehydrogenase family protein [Kordiimonadaceae bacterium]MBO6567326.1 aldehyde dehydrogenase family protein [Kordiimonadaceae bacterium]MBO6963460.1 aldehyde dehydrogenase family protein [Kordiimonadaceae bacterium]
MSLDVRNPHSGEVDYRIDPVAPDEVAAACKSLRQAQPAWEALGYDGRTKVLRAFAAGLMKKKAEIHHALTADTGRSYISAMEIDGIPGAVERWVKAAEELAEDTGRAGAMPFIEYSVGYRPYQLVGVISPWNFPLTLSFIDALPALMAGSAVIIKPSEVTPRFAKPVREVIEQIAELEGVLTIVDGAGDTGAALVDNVDMVCFTGSVATGRKVGEQAARNFIPSCLELGGKDPAIVLESADIERASTSLLRSSVLNTGQACQSIERIYVAEPIFDEFLAKLVEKAKAVTINTPDINSGQIGPIIFEKQATIIADQIADARDKGATIHSGGEVEKHGGNWCRPTVITNLTPDMKIMREETFGPLLPVIPFDTVEEAVAMANDSEYGLSGAVFAASAEEAITVGRQIDAGGISINDGSLTGMMHEAEKNSFKLSGMGPSRMGRSGFLRFFRRQSMMVNTADVAPLAMFDEANANAS